MALTKPGACHSGRRISHTQHITYNVSIPDVPVIIAYCPILTGMQNLKDERSSTKPDQLKMVKWLQMTFVTVEFLTAKEPIIG